jgi:hypothetical protein
MLAYCDYISALINEKLVNDLDSVQTVLKEVGSTKWDLHPEEGYFLSTKKTIDVMDKGGKKYRITVEEL